MLSMLSYNNIIEIFIVSYGALSFAGLAALMAGSMFLFRTEDSYISVSQHIIFLTIGVFRNGNINCW